MPGEPETMGLLALMLLQRLAPGRADRRLRRRRCRCPSRTATRGTAPQSRKASASWRSIPGREQPGPYRIQAQIAACHARATQPEDTDWAAIARLYAELAVLAPSPVVELNRAVAVGMADGPAAGLAIADDLAASGELAGYHLLPAVRADLLRRLDRPAEAADAYRRQSTRPAPIPSATTSSAA